MFGEGLSSCIRQFCETGEVERTLTLGKGLSRRIRKFGETVKPKPTLMFGEGLSRRIRKFGETVKPKPALMFGEGLSIRAISTSGTTLMDRVNPKIKKSLDMIDWSLGCLNCIRRKPRCW
jgi:ribosomal protein L25 (general stress protein Ctc)